MSKTDYVVQLSKLPLGISKFDFLLDDRFFVECESYDVSGAQVNVELQVARSQADSFELLISMKGWMATACDRCLDPVRITIESENNVSVQLDATLREAPIDNENDEQILLPAQPGEIDLRQLFYEFAELALPMQRLHDEEDCDQQMIGCLCNCKVVELDELDEFDQDNEGEQEIDSRWEALKELQKKNNEQ